MATRNILTPKPNMGYGLVWLVTIRSSQFKFLATPLAQGNIKEWGHTNKSKSTNEHTKHKPRLNAQKNTRPNRAAWTGPASCAHGKLPMYSLNARDYFSCSPLLFSWPAPWNSCGQTERGRGLINWALSYVHHPTLSKGKTFESLLFNTFLFLSTAFPHNTMCRRWMTKRASNNKQSVTVQKHRQ